MTKLSQMNRRGFLAASGSLTLAFALPLMPAFAADPVELPADLKNNPMLDMWIRINANGTVNLNIGKVELGQGVLTAYAQVTADHLDVGMDRLIVTAGDTAETPDQGTTAGSGSMPAAYSAMRLVAAEVREIMLGLAAEKLGVATDSLTVDDGTITTADGRSATYWNLVDGKVLHREATGKAYLKAPDELKIVGTSVPRIDIPSIMNGEAIFLQDQRPEGMVFGQVVRPPTYKARLISLDTAAVEAMQGVIAVVRRNSFIGVVALSKDQALQAATALSRVASWEVEKDLPGSANMKEWLRTQEAVIEKKKEQVRASGPAPSKVVAQEYYRPYQMHGSMGTSAAIATLESDGVTKVMTHSQSVGPTAKAIAKLLGVEEGKVRLQHVQAAGCYGHNMADDAAADAALLAQAVPGKPVFLQYTREDEHLWEPYGSAMLVTVTAGVDGAGDVLDWELDVYSTPHGARPGGNPSNLVSAKYWDPAFDVDTIPKKSGGGPNYNTARNAIADYDFPTQIVTDRYIRQAPVRVSSTRGLGAYGNIFAIESFMDELAHSAGVDPVEYRLRHMKEPRARECIETAAARFGWSGFKKERNRGRGFAFARYKNYAAMSALALEVEVNPRNGRIRVLRANTASDAGQVVNPDGLINQIEGGLIQMLSWTLKEEVRFDDTAIQSSDWASYPFLTFTEVPTIDSVVINRPGESYLGAGEALTGQAAAAVANAVFDATGVRMRDLPFTPPRVQAALKA
jgi:CO/xanthine dehydrogenase Mo-binding subunit